MPTMDEEDWIILQAAYEQMGSGEGWTNTWDFDVERRTVQTLPGVSILGGHVTSIDLSSRNLTGAFPVKLLDLPQLRSLNLSGNKLAGDVSALSGFATENTLQSLNISNNQLSGNIGVFAALLPNLTTLYAQKNRFDKVTPMISPAVTTLNIGSQSLTTVLDVDLTNVSVTELLEQTPNILLYDHKQQTFGNSLTFTATAEDGWQSTVNMSDAGVKFTKKSEQNDYHGQSGDAIQIAADNGNAKGTTLKMKLSFGQGDANFNGKADVVDLQAQINFAFEDYNDKPFNFTAANLWVDEVINVQDVVKMTDLLLIIDNAAARTGASPMAAHRIQSSYQSSSATLYVKDGQVWVDTDTPVAAFELTLSGAKDVSVCDQMKQMGFTCRTNSLDDVTRVVGYSMNGATLPVGKTAICHAGQAVIVSAVLSDSDAEEIAVRLTGGETTAIDDSQVYDLQRDDSAVYDLSGRKLSNSQMKKGLYIQNGKKMLVK